MPHTAWITTDRPDPDVDLANVLLDAVVFAHDDEHQLPGYVLATFDRLADRSPKLAAQVATLVGKVSPAHRFAFRSVGVCR